MSFEKDNGVSIHEWMNWEESKSIYIFLVMLITFVVSGGRGWNLTFL